LAAAPLGIKCHIFAPETESPAFQVAAANTAAGYSDEGALASFAASVDVVTYEFENVPAATAAFLAERVPVAPGVAALETAQDRATEKTFMAGLGIEVAPFATVATLEDLERALQRIGRPSILKTRRFGYDGKGQTRIDDGTSPATALAEIGHSPAILEGLVRFDKEVSVIAARGWDGRISTYDVPENVHACHILKTSSVPADITPAVADKAKALGARIAKALDYVGVIGIEMFVAGEQLIVNEIAPRVHNSGHWTMDACCISQFEQHIRAICGWPLGSTERHCDVVMTNLLGDEANRWRELAAEPDVRLHLYGKRDTRRGRKMGHYNRLTPRQA
jgi:5-(carboxyamino)imidazole ribonucleotide synthase